MHYLVDIYCITTCTCNDRGNWKAACVHMRIGLNINQPKQSKNPKYPPLSQLRAQLVQQNTQSYMATILYNNCGIQEKPKMSLYFSGSRAGFWISYVNSQPSWSKAPCRNWISLRSPVSGLEAMLWLRGGAASRPKLFVNTLKLRNRP